ncbi:MAG: alpha/beta hydrolase [Bacteroidota bacterium]
MLHYRTYGYQPDRDWVVFIHGAGGSMSIWFKQIRAFRSQFNVLLVDLRGHGQSQNLIAATRHHRYTFEEISAEVIEVLDHLEIDRAHFVGISLGSILIRTIGEMAPARVQSMVLGGAVTRLNVRSRFLVAIGNLFKRVLPYLWLYKLFAWIIMPHRTHRASRLLFVQEAKKLCQAEFIRWYRLTYEVNPLLRFFEEKELSTPTLYLMGEDDHMFLPPVRTLVRKHRHSTLSVVKESGHVVSVDQPHVFNEQAIAFIQAHR